MNIRKARESDIIDVSHLVKGLSQYYLQDSTMRLPEWFNESLVNDAFSERFRSSEYNNFVVELESKIVGYISVKSGFHIYHLFVLKEFHGKGIEKELWQHCVKELMIKTCTVRSSLFAVPIYKKLGFTIDGNIAFKDGLGFQPMVYIAPGC